MILTKDIKTFRPANAADDEAKELLPKSHYTMNPFTPDWMTVVVVVVGWPNAYVFRIVPHPLSTFWDLARRGLVSISTL